MNILLTYYKLEDNLLDDKGVKDILAYNLYKSKLKIKYIWAMIIAALFPVLILAYLSPTTQQFIRIMQLKLKLLLNNIAEIKNMTYVEFGRWLEDNLLNIRKD